MYITEAVDSFRKEQASLGLAVATLKSNDVYLRKLQIATREWGKLHGKRSPMKTSEIDGHLVTMYFDRCTGGAGNRNNMNATLRNFIDYCERQRWVESGTRNRLLSNRKNQGYQRAPKHYVDATDFPALIECQTRHPSDRVTMALLLFTLCRKSELYGLRIENVDLANQTLRVFRQKTQRYTEVGICPELATELEKWLLEYQYLLDVEKLNPEWWLLPRLDPQRERAGDGRWVGKCHTYEVAPTEHPRHMERVVKRGLDALGVTSTVTTSCVNHKGEGAHTIRRSGARALLKSLSPKMGQADALVTVAAMLDHSDVKVTLRYIGMDQQKEELNRWLRGTESMYG